MSLFGSEQRRRDYRSALEGVTFSPFEETFGESPYAIRSSEKSRTSSHAEVRHTGEMMMLTTKMRQMQSVIDDLEKQNMSLALSKGSMEPWTDQEENLALHVARLLRDNKALHDQLEEMADELKLAKLDLERARISEASVRFQLEHQLQMAQTEESELRKQLQERYEQALRDKEEECKEREELARSESDTIIVNLKMRIQALIAEHEDAFFNGIRGRDEQIVILKEKELFLSKEVAALREEVKDVKAKANRYKDDCRAEVDAARRALQKEQDKASERGRGLAELREAQEGAHAGLVEELDKMAAERDRLMLENDSLINTLHNTKQAHTRQFENVRTVDSHVRAQLVQQKQEIEQLREKLHRCESMRKQQERERVRFVGERGRSPVKNEVEGKVRMARQTSDV